MKQNTDAEGAEIQTGVDANNSRTKTTAFDVEAYADNSEYAMCWMLRRIDDTTIESQAIACEAGLRDSHGDREVFDVDADTSTLEFAREHANADPQLAIEQARKHFN